MVGWFASGAFAQGNLRYYAATTSTGIVNAGSTSVYSITITNCDAGTCDGIHNTSTHQQLGSATITVPTGITNITSLSVSAAGGTKCWDVYEASGIIYAGAVDCPGGGKKSGAGNQKLEPGESAVISFSAEAPCLTGPYTWVTDGSNETLGDTFSGNFTLVNSDPVINIAGSCGFTPGDYCTFSQGGWGATPHGNNPGALLAGSFYTVYSSPTGVQIGGDATNNASPYGIQFTAAQNIESYLPAGGKPGSATSGSLTADFVNPVGTTNTGAGVFGGQVLALRLNVDFSAADIPSTPDSGLGNLTLKNYNPTSLNGKTVAEISAAAELALSTGILPSGFTFSSLNDLITNINEAFDGCTTVSQFAEDHLQ